MPENDPAHSDRRNRANRRDRGWSDDVRFAVAALSRIRVAAGDPISPLSATRAMRAYPLVGAGLGLAAGAAFAVAAAIGLPAVAAALIAVATAIALSGAAPERATAGFVAAAAGFAASSSPTPRLGVAAIVGLAVTIGVRTAAIVVLGEVWLVVAVLIVAAAASRATIPVLAFLIEAPGEAEEAPQPGRDTAVTAAVLGALAVFALIEVWTGLVAMAAAAFAAAAVAFFARGRAGGANANSPGAAQHLAELAFLIAVLAMR